MNGESASQFKLFRVLWFPMSVNALTLGAIAAVLFWVGTWLACAVIGDGKMATHSVRAFTTASKDFITTGMWPGFATDIHEKEPTHHLLATATPSAEDRAAAAKDQAQIDRLFANYVAEVRTRIESDTDLKAEDKVAKARDVITRTARYRSVFGIQLVLFFALLATFGVAICRVVALRIARDEYCTMGSALGYAWKIRLTCLLFPVAVLIPLVLLGCCNAIAGAVFQVPWIGWLLSCLLFPLVIVSSVIIVVTAVAGLISIGLVPAAIAIERKGTFDSLGKAFNYIFARPIPLILYLMIVGVFLEVVQTLLIEHALVERILSATLTPFFDWKDYSKIAAGETSSLSGFAWLMGWIHQVLWLGYRVLVIGTLISYALGAFTSMFLIFRQDVDGIDSSDVATDS